MGGYWGDKDYAKRGAEARKAVPRVKTEVLPGWWNMVPVKRYEHHTLYAKKTRSGQVYFESFLNIDIDGKVHYE